MERAEMKEIVIKREDGTEEVFNKGLVMYFEGDDINIDMTNFKPIDLCRALIGLSVTIDQMGLKEDLSALIDYYNKKSEEAQELE